jgi:iron complex outermembrane receptor protein
LQNHTNLFKPALSVLALAISANVSMMAQAAESLETVIVTAGKVESDIQKTAVSMQSLSGEKLADSGVASVADVAKLVPGLQLDQTGSGVTATVRIRGIGTPGNSALDPSVPLFIDGVAQARTGAGFQDLLDVARVEVLRGPQGTLYGRNSTAGALNVWTKDVSTNNWEGSVQGQVGNYNDKELKGTVNVPLIEDKLGARISMFKVNQDGYVENDYNGDTGNGYADRFGARAKVLLVATDNLNIQWIVDYSKVINHPMTVMTTAPALFNNYVTANGGTAAHPGTQSVRVSDPYGDTYQDYRNWSKDTNLANSLTVNWDITEGFLKDHSFTSITASQYYNDAQELEQDFSELQWATTHGTAKTKSWSQEFRISSDSTENWEYLGGLFYYYEDLQSDQHTDGLFPDHIAAFNYPSLGVSHASNAFSQDTINSENAAVFGQATYAFTEKLSVTAGLRYSVVEKKGNNFVDADTCLAPWIGAINGGGTCFSQRIALVDHDHQAENDLSGVLKARYQLQDDVMLYGSFDRGFKPGGFNRLVTPSANLATSYQKENSNNFEVGAKTQWLDNTIQANIALFHMEFLNYHNQTTDGSNNLIIENIKKVTDDGVELDVQALAAPGLTVGGSLAYINPRVKDAGLKGSEGSSQNLTKNQLINDVAQRSANLNAEYAHALGDGPAEGFVRGDLVYRGSTSLSIVAVDEDQLYHQGGYTLSNIRFGVRKLDEHWQLTGWVNNMFDKEYVVEAGTGFADQADGVRVNRGAPRTFGVSAQYDY